MRKISFALFLILLSSTAMASWFKRKTADIEFRSVDLPGNVGTVSLPTSYEVEWEEESTLLAYPKNQPHVSLRFSSISFESKDGDENTAKPYLRKLAEEKGYNYNEINTNGYFSYEETSEQDNVPLLIKYWKIGDKNTIVILSATIDERSLGNEIVKNTLGVVPKIVETLKITKLHRTIEADGQKIETTVQEVDSFPQTIRPFNDSENSWLVNNIEIAKQLSMKYGSGGPLTPNELDTIFAKWMSREGEKESDENIANSLGAAFGSYLVDQHNFNWMVLTDQYGTEYTVKHKIGETMAFPRSSIMKRIEDGSTDLFVNIYYIILDRIKNADSEKTKK